MLSEKEIIHPLAVEHLSQREAAEKLHIPLRTYKLRLEVMRIEGGYKNTREMMVAYLHQWGKENKAA